MRSNTLHLLGALVLSSSALARIIPASQSQDQFVQHGQNNGNIKGDGVDSYDGVPTNQITTTGDTESKAALPAGAQAMAATGWTATADSYQAGYPPSNAIDGNANSFWHTPFGANGNALPHYIIVDMKTASLVNSISYQPRQDGQSNGNIGGHQVALSLDGINFATPKAIGTWLDDATTKTSSFEATNARYLKLTALTEAGARGPWTSIAELQIYTTTTAPPAYGNGIYGGEWSPTIDFPLVPVSAALLPNSGNVLVWSSYAASTYGGSDGTTTLTAYYYPGSQTVSQRTVTNVQHDMFCEGLSLDAQGRIISTGGNTAQKTSAYVPGSDQWAGLPDMYIQRGYQAQATTSGGRTFVIGGSWSGGTGGKDAEIYDPTRNVWDKLPGCPVANMLTQDAQGVYRADNHGMLFAWKNEYIFQAGPSKQMNWYNPLGNGYVAGVGNRNNDGDAMCGIAAMYDAVAGKILVTGGATSYQNVDSTANANIITLAGAGGNVGVQTINPMWYQRIFACSVIMPNGYVMIVGGQVYGQPFSDDTSQLTPEIYNIDTGNFYKIPPIAVPRNYHSVALLLADATVFSAGGGLCGTCTTNHYDGQVYSPGYLFNTDGTRAVRPVINSATATINPGGTITATTNGAIAKWSLIRLGSTTHTVNTDQRRIPLTATANGNTYTMTTPTDKGVIIAGYYMLFAMNAQGTPSIAKYVFVNQT